MCLTPDGEQEMYNDEILFQFLKMNNINNLLDKSNLNSPLGVRGQ